MAAGDQEKTLILKAADLSSQPIRDVVAQMEKLVDVQKRLNQASDAGKAKEGEFKGALQNTTAIATALVNAKSNLQQYNDTLNRYEAQLEKVSAQERKLAELRAKTPADDKEAGSLEKQIARAEKALASAQKAADSAYNVFDRAGQALERMGVSFDGIGEAEHVLSTALAQLLPVVQEANVALLTLGENHRKAAEASAAEAAANRKFAEENRALNAQRAADDAKLLQAENFRRQTAANARRVEIEDTFKLYAAKEEAAKKEAITNAALRASREKIADAVEALPKTQPVGQAPVIAPNISEAGESIRGIIDPAGQARSTLEGLNAEIDKNATILEGARKKDKDYQKTLRDLSLAYIDLARISSLGDTFKQNQVAADALNAAYRREEATLQAMVALNERSKVSNVQLEAQIARQLVTVRNAANAFNEQNQKVSQSRATMEAAGLGANTYTEDLERLNEVARKAKATFSAVEAQTGEGANGLRFLGLRPYEFKNLTYQINDIGTQLASGTSLTQTLSQQAGQIFQLYEDKIGAFLLRIKSSPTAIAGVTAAFSLLTLAVLTSVRAFEEFTARQGLIGQLSLDVDGARISIDKLVESSKQLRGLGVGLTDATKGARELAAQGFSQDQIDKLSKLAALLASSQGISFADAIKQVGSAFGGSYKDLEKFVDKYNLFDRSTAESIRNLYNEGKATEGFSSAVEKALAKAQKAHEDSSSAIGNAYRGLTVVYNGFIDSLVRGTEVAVNGALRLAEISDNVERGKYGSVDKRGQSSLLDPGVAAPNTPPTGGTNPNALNRRNRNPQNLIFKGQEGATPDFEHTSETGLPFAKFATEEAGVKASANQILLDQSRGFDTLEKLILKYTPRKGNPNVDSYIDNAARELNVGRNDKLPPLDRNALIAIIQAIARQEGGVPARDALETGVDARLGRASEGSQRVTTSVLRETNQETDKLNDKRVEGADIQRRQNELIDQELEKLATKAREEAKSRGQIADEDQIRLAGLRRANELRKQFAEERKDREDQEAQRLDSLRDDQAAKDKTNLVRQLQLVDAKYEKEKKAAEDAFKGLSGAQTVNGRDRQGTLDFIEDARQKARVQATIETAKAILQAAEDAKKSALETITLSRKSAAESAKAIDEVNKRENPKIVAAGQRVLDITSGINSPEVDALRARAGASIAGGENQSQATEGAIKQLSDRIQKPLEDFFQRRDNEINTITEQEKARTITFAEAVKRLAEVTSRTGPEGRRLTAETNAGLGAIAGSDSVTPNDRSRLQALQAGNERRAASTQELADRVITEGLRNDQEQLDAIVKERNRTVEHINQQVRDGLINSPLEAARQLAEAAAKFNPKIKEYSKKVVDDISTALTVPNLSPGIKAGLEDKKTQAQQQGNTDKLDVEEARKNILANIARARDVGAGSVADTQRTQQELLSKGLTTQTNAEAAIKRAYDEANKATAQQRKELDTLIDQYSKLGGVSPADVERLRDKVKLLNADLQYTDPLLQQIRTGLENSIASRGEQAFEKIAQSFANLIRNGGKFKDVIAATASAFADFTAGVLEDIAKIILKYVLLKAIKDAIGDDSQDGSGSGTGGGASGAAGSASGVAGILSKLISSFTGGGATSGGAFDGAGISAGASGAGDAASAGTSAFDTIDLAASVAHGGGLIDGSGVRRVVSLDLFRQAQRMHSGGPVLAPDEVPAILQRGERVVSKAQVAAQAGRANTGGGGTAVRNVLAVGNDEIAKAMNGSHGEQVVINHLRRNAPTIKRILGS